MVTVDGAGFSHKFLEHLDTLAARRGYTLIYSCGWELGEREKAALLLVAEGAWEIALDHRGEVRECRADSAGQFTAAAGHFSATVSGPALLARNPDGSCAFFTQPALHEEDMFTDTGTLSF